MKRRLPTQGALVTVAVGVCLATVAPKEAAVPAANVRIPETPEAVAAGKRIYAQRCWWCHGADGHGDGPSARQMFPRPRDLVRANYRIRTTPFGALPTDEDLFRVLSRGMPGTPMPGWEKILTEQELWQVLYYLKTLSPRFAEENPRPIDVPPEPPPTAESIARGEKIYRRARCFLCHGNEGRGDGGVTNALNFEWGLPFRARDFTKSWTFKGGSTARDTFLRITTGLNGTPMGTYAELLTEEERWDLAHYIESLDSGETATSEEFSVTASFLRGSLPESPDDPRWDGTRAVAIPLGGQIVQAPPFRWWIPTASTVEVRAAWNGESVAFRIEWNDPTGGQGPFPDSAMLQFPVSSVEETAKPYFILGDPSHPVDVWHWEETDDAEGVEAWFARGASSIEVWRQSELGAVAGFRDGRRYLVLRRAVQTKDRDHEVQFEPGRFIPILVSVRDGANGESGNLRALSTWLFVSLEGPPSIDPWLMAVAYGLGALLVGGWLVNKVRGAPV